MQFSYCRSLIFPPLIVIFEPIPILRHLFLPPPSYAVVCIIYFILKLLSFIYILYVLVRPGDSMVNGVHGLPRHPHLPGGLHGRGHGEQMSPRYGERDPLVDHCAIRSFSGLVVVLSNNISYGACPNNFRRILDTLRSHPMQPVLCRNSLAISPVALAAFLIYLNFC